MIERTALILGGGDVWCDLESLPTGSVDVGWMMFEHGAPCRLHGRKGHFVPVRWPGPIVAVNDVGCEWPGSLDHWCSMHPRKLKRWIKIREKAGLPMGFTTWAHEKKLLVDRTLTGKSAGSSGLFTCQVVRHCIEQADRGVLCGVPMTPTPHFTESRVHMDGDPWTRADNHFERWQDAESELQGWLKSAGVDPESRTAAMLGRPELQWLRGP